LDELLPSRFAYSLLGALARRMEFSHSASRVSVVAALALPPLVLWAGWFWARTVLSGYQAQVGRIDLQDSPLASHFHRWGIDIPWSVTLAVVGLTLIPAGVVLFRHRPLFVAFLVYALFLAYVSLFVFVGFEFEAFN
jgi:hypothetical protein